MDATTIVQGGTVGLIALLLVIVRLLWDDHRRHDDDVRSQRDEAIAGWREQSAATQAVATSTDRIASTLDRQATRGRAYDGDARVSRKP